MGDFPLSKIGMRTSSLARDFQFRVTWRGFNLRQAVTNNPLDLICKVGNVQKSDTYRQIPYRSKAKKYRD